MKRHPAEAALAIALHDYSVETHRAMLLLEIRVTDLWNAKRAES